MDFFNRLWSLYDSFAYNLDFLEYGKQGAKKSRELHIEAHKCEVKCRENVHAEQVLKAFRKVAQRDTVGISSRANVLL